MPAGLMHRIMVVLHVPELWLNLSLCVKSLCSASKFDLLWNQRFDEIYIKASTKILDQDQNLSSHRNLYQNHTLPLIISTLSLFKVNEVPIDFPYRRVAAEAVSDERRGRGRGLDSCWGTVRGDQFHSALVTVQPCWKSTSFCTLQTLACSVRPRCRCVDAAQAWQDSGPTWWTPPLEPATPVRSAPKTFTLSCLFINLITFKEDLRFSSFELSETSVEQCVQVAMYWHCGIIWNAQREALNHNKCGLDGK